MPPRRSTRFRKTRKPRRKSFRRKTMAITPSLGRGLGFPPRLTVNHRYIESYQILSVGGVFQKNFFNMNGMFDPRAAAGGHQPRFYDQLTALYNHYVVLGSKITIKVMPYYTNTAGVRAGITRCDDLTLGGVADLDTASERRGAKVTIFPLGASNSKTLTQTYSARKTWGTRSPSAKDALVGSVSADPTEASYCCFMFEGEATVNTSVFVTVQVDYKALWFEKTDTASS